MEGLTSGPVRRAPKIRFYLAQLRSRLSVLDARFAPDPARLDEVFSRVRHGVPRTRLHHRSHLLATRRAARALVVAPFPQDVHGRAPVPCERLPRRQQPQDMARTGCECRGPRVPVFSESLPSDSANTRRGTNRVWSAWSHPPFFGGYEDLKGKAAVNTQ